MKYLIWQWNINFLLLPEEPQTFIEPHIRALELEQKSLSCLAVQCLHQRAGCWHVMDSVGGRFYRVSLPGFKEYPEITLPHWDGKSIDSF